MQKLSELRAHFRTPDVVLVYEVRYFIEQLASKRLRKDDGMVNQGMGWAKSFAVCLLTTKLGDKRTDARHVLEPLVHGNAYGRRNLPHWSLTFEKCREFSGDRRRHRSKGRLSLASFQLMIELSAGASKASARRM